MTNRPTKAREAELPEDVIALAEASFDLAVDWMLHEIEKWDSGETIETEKAVKSWEAVARASQSLVNVRLRLHDQKLKLGTAEDADSVDMDAARARIGGLLDRLRATRDAGSVPGEPER